MALGLTFAFDPTKGETPETVARKRAMIAQLMASQRRPQNVGEGIGAMLSGAAAGIMNTRANREEAAGRESASEAFNALDLGSLLSGGDASAYPASVAQGGSPTSDAALGANAIQTADISGSRKEFVDTLLPAAIEESKRTGIDPRIIVAQAAQETGWGKSAPGNNFFGIKSHGKDGGQTFATHEYVNGKRVNINDSFRTFASPADSVRGYGDFILENPRYKGLRSAQGLDAQLEALQASGYATDPNYSRSVGAIARGIQLPTVADVQAPIQVASLDPSAGTSALPVTGGQMPPPDQRSEAEAAWAANLGIPETLTPDQRVASAHATSGENNYPEAGRIAPHDFTANPDLSVAAGVPFDGAQVGALPPQDAAQQFPAQSPDAPRAGVTEALLRQNDMALGGALAPQGQTQQVADASGSFPAAPSPDRASIQPQGQGGRAAVVQQLMQLSANPWASDSQKAVVDAILERELRSSDPLRALQMEKARIELENLRNPTPERQSLVNAGDGRVYDPNTSQWIIAPNSEKPPEAPTTREFYDESTGMSYIGQWNPSTGQWDRVGGVKAPSGTQLSVDPTTGAVTFQQGSGLKPLTEGQSKDAVFATRAEGSIGIIDELGNALTSLPESVAGNLPGGNYLQSEAYQRAQQAGKEFLQAILRKDTGAAITKEETEEYGSVYLPRPGDKPEVLEQKKISRRRALEAIKAGMPPQAILQAEQALRNTGSAQSQSQGAPSGVDQSLWDVMTPEERSLWQN